MTNTKSFTSISTDNEVTQRLFWDKDTKKIEVYHEMNIEAGDVYRESIKTYNSKDTKYSIVAKQYGVKNNQTITIYHYIHTPDGPAYPRSLRFPEQGGFYPLEDIPHVIIAIKEPSGTSSTAQGEAL